MQPQNAQSLPPNAQPGLQPQASQGLGQGLSGLSAQPAPPAPQAPALPGADTGMMGQLQQMLSNPNAGDAFTNQAAGTVPGQLPGMGANPAGVPPNPFAAGGIPGFPGPQEMILGAGGGIAMAKGLEAISTGSNPWISRVAHRLDKAPILGSVSNWLDAKMKATHNPRIQALFSRMSPAHFEAQVLEDTLKSARPRFEKLGKLGAYQQLMDEATQLKTMPASKYQSGKAVESIMGKLSSNGLAEEKSLRGTFNRLKGLNTNIIGPYTKKHALLAKSQAGPIGRFVVSLSDSIRRIFVGETAQMSGKLLRFAPALIGAMVIGQSIKEAKDAAPGEKVKSFFHNFLGVGLGMFVGMEAGMKILGSTGVVSKVLKGKNVSRLFGKFSVGGVAATILGWFVLSIPFQKAGEMLSHAIFGKPSKEQEEHRKKQGYHPPGPLTQNWSPDKGITNREYKNIPPSKEVQDHATQQNGQAANFSVTPEQITQSPAAEQHQVEQQTVLGADTESGFNSRNPLLPDL